MKYNFKILINLTMLIAFSHGQTSNIDLKFPYSIDKNKTQIKKKLISTYDNIYSQVKNPLRKSFSASDVYYLRQEMQSLIDMWYATENINYLNTAKDISFKAIDFAIKNPKPLISSNDKTKKWPCFYEPKLEKITGGHGQLYDFQGAAGFMLVATALKDANQTEYKVIADFIEKNIIEKWLFQYSYPIDFFQGIEANTNLLKILNPSRDKREHFASICLNFHNLGYNKYPYKKWSEFLINLYLGKRENINQKSPYYEQLKNLDPQNWGIAENISKNGYIWYWTNNQLIQDTSHANRTVWLACQAYENKLIDHEHLNGFINTFKNNIWKPEKKPFYFTNYIDGSDGKVQSRGPGQKGNVWFGWHRLAEYDKTLKELFINMSIDLTEGSKKFPKLSQNTKMENAPLCLIAWGTRLLKNDI